MHCLSKRLFCRTNIYLKNYKNSCFFVKKKKQVMFLFLMCALLLWWLLFVLWMEWKAPVCCLGFQGGGEICVLWFFCISWFRIILPSHWSDQAATQFELADKALQLACLTMRERKFCFKKLCFSILKCFLYPVEHSKMHQSKKPTRTT